MNGMDELRMLADADRLFSTEAARRAGYRHADLARLTRDGFITSVHQGWYAVGSPETEQDRHQLRTAAAERRHSGRAVASHYSELIRLGVPIFRADLRTVHLTRVGRGYPRRRPGLSVHPQVALPLTDAGRIAPQLAIVQAGTVCGPMAALIAADAALGRGLVSRKGLSDAVEALRGLPGTAPIRQFLETADGRAQSPGETRLRHAFHVLQIPVTPQAKITAGGRTAYVDFLLDDYPVVVEFDGLVKYGAQGLRPGRDELVAEKHREDWLRELGYEVVRVTWKDLDDLAALALRIRAAIGRAKARRR